MRGREIGGGLLRRARAARNDGGGRRRVIARSVATKQSRARGGDGGVWGGLLYCACAARNDGGWWGRVFIRHCEAARSGAVAISSGFSRERCVRAWSEEWLLTDCRQPCDKVRSGLLRRARAARNDGGGRGRVFIRHCEAARSGAVAISSGFSRERCVRAWSEEWLLTDCRQPCDKVRSGLPRRARAARNDGGGFARNDGAWGRVIARSVATKQSRARGGDGGVWGGLLRRACAARNDGGWWGRVIARSVATKQSRARGDDGGVWGGLLRRACAARNDDAWWGDGGDRQALSVPFCRQILPLGIHALNEPDLLGAVSALQLLLSCDGARDIAKGFIVAKFIDMIASRKSGRVDGVAMFAEAFFQVARDADVERSVGTIKEDIDEGALHGSIVSYCRHSCGKARNGLLRRARAARNDGGAVCGDSVKKKGPGDDGE